MWGMGSGIGSGVWGMGSGFGECGEGWARGVGDGVREGVRVWGMW